MIWSFLLFIYLFLIQSKLHTSQHCLNTFAFPTKCVLPDIAQNWKKWIATAATTTTKSANDFTNVYTADAASSKLVLNHTQKCSSQLCYFLQYSTHTSLGIWFCDCCCVGNTFSSHVLVTYSHLYKSFWCLSAAIKRGNNARTVSHFCSERGREKKKLALVKW